jgi:hypothetical protein
MFRASVAGPRDDAGAAGAKLFIFSKLIIEGFFSVPPVLEVLLL